MWYRFEEGNPVGIPRVKEYHVAFYDMERDGHCFDEDFFKPEDIALAIPFVETDEDKDNADRHRVFVNFDDGQIYELKLVNVTGRKRGYFYDE